MTVDTQSKTPENMHTNDMETCSTRLSPDQLKTVLNRAETWHLNTAALNSIIVQEQFTVYTQAYPSSRKTKEAAANHLIQQFHYKVWDPI